MTTDNIADMLTRIRNAVLAGHDSTVVPLSKEKLAIAKILKNEGFIVDFELLKGTTQKIIKVKLKFLERNKSAISGLKRVSKPGLRIYVQKGEIPRVYGGLGIAILSTSKGIMTGQESWRENVGGELLCYIW